MPFSQSIESSCIRYPTPTSVKIYLGCAGLISIFLLIFAILTRKILLSSSAYGPHTLEITEEYVITLPEFLAR